MVFSLKSCFESSDHQAFEQKIRALWRFVDQIGEALLHSSLKPKIDEIEFKFTGRKRNVVKGESS